MTLRGFAGVLCVVAVCFPSLAWGSLMHEDPLAMSAWRGTETFYSTDGSYELNVEVDYAVYAPGTYPGADPSGGTDYVYAYEARNLIDSASAEVSVLTVGLAPKNGARNIVADSSSGAPGTPGGVVPGSTRIGSTSARWYFTSDPIVYGEDSAALVFTSPHGPRWMTGSVADGGLSDAGPVPSPTPEPNTLALAVLGGLGLVARRLRR